jgi:hypothetical protein
MFHSMLNVLTPHKSDDELNAYGDAWQATARVPHPFTGEKCNCHAEILKIDEGEYATRVWGELKLHSSFREAWQHLNDTLHIPLGIEH